MKNEIQQMIALAIAGTARLHGRTSPLTWPQSAAFQFCKNVNFVVSRPGPQQQPAPYAPDPMAWFARLATDGIHLLQLDHSSSEAGAFEDRLTAGFVGGGGIWTLQARRSDDLVDIWQSGWNVAHRDDPERRIWDVCYARVSEALTPSSAAPIAIDGARDRLQAALKTIHAFAAEHDLNEFAACFAGALETLNSESSNLEHTCLSGLEPLIPLPARLILASAAHSWVFMGMGSWNDLTFSGEEAGRYEMVSDALYQAICQGIVVATNVSSGQLTRRGHVSRGGWWTRLMRSR